MAVLEHQTGDKVLYVAPSTVNQQAFLQAKETSQSQVGANGAVAFEVLERVADGKEKWRKRR